MKRVITTSIAAFGFAALTSTAFAQTGAETASAKTKGMSKCMSAARSYHDRDARLFLNNKGTVQTVEGKKVYRVKGWVYRDGERIGVTHECSPAARNKVAMRVRYDVDEGQVADL